MKISLEDLMRRVGCINYPIVEEKFLVDAMEAYEREGLEIALPGYFENLERKYGCFGSYLMIFVEAARRVALDEWLSRYLALLVKLLHQKDWTDEEWLPLSELYPPEGADEMAYAMAPGLALCTQLEDMVDSLTAKGIPKEMIIKCLKAPVAGVISYQNKHDGRPGHNLLWWQQRNIKGRIFQIGRLEYELGIGFPDQAVVFCDDRGEIITLANDIELHRSGFALGSVHYEDRLGSWKAQIQENEWGWVGYPYGSNGLVASQTVFLKKGKWKKILEPKDQVISIHIPGGEKLTPALVDESLCAAKEFIAAYYPDVEYKAFICGSWLMDPQVCDLAGEESNITKFNRRFTPMTIKSQGRAVFGFVFLKPDNNFNLAELPENTRLERKLKAHYLSGKAVYEMYGFFLP